MNFRFMSVPFAGTQVISSCENITLTLLSNSGRVQLKNYSATESQRVIFWIPNWPVVVPQWLELLIIDPESPATVSSHH